MSIAIITGASSGLGAEFARQIAAQEPVDELWLLARRTKRLEALAAELPIATRVFSIDLTNPFERQNFARSLSSDNPDVKLLINAAGFGKLGDYGQISEQDCEDMIELKCKALTAMTNMTLPYLSRGARILQISSTSAFLPLPGFNVYAAVNSYVLHYSRALRAELRPRGIGVSAVCPYWIADTEFIHIAEQTEHHRYPFAVRKEAVVSMSLRLSRYGAAVITPDVPSTLSRLATKIVPKTPVLAIYGLLQGKKETKEAHFAEENP